MILSNRILLLLISTSLIASSYSEVATVDLLTGGSCGILSRVAGGRVTSFQPFDVAPPITNNITCFFTMRAVRNREKVRLAFEHFDLKPSDCSISNLEIFDGVTDTRPLLTRLCPGENIVGREFLSTSYYLTLKLNVASGGSVLPLANFSAYWVSYTDDRDPCPTDTEAQLRCANARCIYAELQCDSLDSCGDGTDESNDPPLSCPTDGSVENGPDLTPLYVTLTLAFAMFCAYLAYALLSVNCFKQLMMKSLTRCCVLIIRKRRLWREAKYQASSQHQQSKVAPEESKKELPSSIASDLTIEEMEN